MGWRIALPVAVGAFGGLLLDNKFHTKPLIALIGLGIGTFISFRLVYKLFKQFAEEQKNIQAAAKILRASDTPVLLVKMPAREETIRERRLFNSILLPLDGSKLGEAAIPHATALAREVGARLTLLRVIELYSGGGRAERYLGSGDESKQVAHTYLEKVQKVLEETGLSASSAVKTGDPASEIISYAAANRVDLICVSSHGESGVSHWVFGSVTDKLLHAGDTPVIMVRRTKKV